MYNSLIQKKLNEMRRINLIDTVIKETGLTQTQIADRVNVSKSTISAWRMGARIPPIKERRLMHMLRADRRQASTKDETFSAWRELVKTPENSRNWAMYLRSLGVNLHPHWKRILIALSELGVDIPQNAPERLHLNSTRSKVQGNEDYELESTWEEDEVVSPSKLKPLDILLIKLLTNLNILDEWCEMFLPKTRDGESTQKSRIIQFKLVDIAFLHIDPTLLINLDADPKPFISSNNKAKKLLSKVIQSLCEELIASRSNLRTDYFEIIRVSPDHLIKIISDYEVSSMSEPNIEDYLSYGEKRIYEAIKENMRLQSQLIERLEAVRIDSNQNVQMSIKNESLLTKINKLLIQNF